jgi:hypothetical protein
MANAGLRVNAIGAKEGGSGPNKYTFVAFDWHRYRIKRIEVGSCSADKGLLI